MKDIKYNDLWAILENMPKHEAQRLPQKYRDFVKASMLEDATSSIRTDIPLEQQTISDKTQSLLSFLYLTYWASSAQDRRDFAELLMKNEQAYQGEPITAMTEETYQEFLLDFDDFNEIFGPMPFWAESRHWYPEICFEIVSSDDQYDIKAGETCIKEVYVSLVLRERIVEEAKQWTLIKTGTSSQKLHSMIYGSTEVTTSEENNDFYQKYVLIRDGHFYGALIKEEQNEDAGILCIDGFSDGCISEERIFTTGGNTVITDISYSLVKK